MRFLTASALVLALALSAGAQIIPKDAKEPVEVVKGKGEFAKKLNGALMPTGKGWKPVLDPQKRLQVMAPDGWKADATEGEDILKVVPPGADAGAGLIIVFSEPRDADPLEIDERFALNYADSLADDPMLKRVNFKATDSGLVIARGLKFALAGGTMGDGGKEQYQQQQLVYISEDRIVTLQFTARSKDWEKWSGDVAKIFASYQNIGVRKPLPE